MVLGKHERISDSNFYDQPCRMIEVCKIYCFSRGSKINMHKITTGERGCYTCFVYNKTENSLQ